MRTLFGFLALTVFGTGARADDSAGPPPEAADPAAEAAPTWTAEETRYVELADSLATLLEERTIDESESVALVEAEEIAGVAEELLIEGDPDLANVLLEEAIALVVASVTEEVEPR